LGLPEWRGSGLQPVRQTVDNCYVESFNGRLRDECLDIHWFLSIEDSRAKIEAWRMHYNAS
jgi:putative transposase